MKMPICRRTKSWRASEPLCALFSGYYRPIGTLSSGRRTNIVNVSNQWAVLWNRLSIGRLFDLSRVIRAVRQIFFAIYGWMRANCVHMYYTPSAQLVSNWIILPYCVGRLAHPQYCTAFAISVRVISEQAAYVCNTHAYRMYLYVWVCVFHSIPICTHLARSMARHALSF